MADYSRIEDFVEDLAYNRNELVEALDKIVSEETNEEMREKVKASADFYRNLEIGIKFEIPSEPSDEAEEIDFDEDSED